jgi:hypothetical protein
MLGKNHDIKAVMVANDTMAGAVVTDLKRQSLNGKVAVSGQDATAEGLQHIMDGDQCFTIYKPSTAEADPAIKAIAQLANGKVPDTKGVTGRGPADPQEGPGHPRHPGRDHQGQRGDADQRQVHPKNTVCTGAYADSARRPASTNRHDPVPDGRRPEPAVATARRPAPSHDRERRGRSCRAMSDHRSSRARRLQELRPVDVLKGVDFAVPPARSPPWSVTTAPASRRWSSASRHYTIDSATTSSRASPSTVHSPRDASALGIEIVYQDLALCDNLDIVQNMFLGGAAVRHRLDESSMEQARERRSVAVRAHRAVGAPARRQPVRRSAPDRGDRQGRAVELQGGRARRADRRPRRRPDAPRSSASYDGSPTAARPSC